MSSSTRRIQQQQQQQQQRNGSDHGGGSSSSNVVRSRYLSRDNNILSSSSSFSSQQLLNQRRESIKNMADVDKIQVCLGVSLQGIELENFCRKRGLCPLCAKVQIRKRVFKLFKKAKWEPLTITSKDSSTSSGSSSDNKASSKGQGGYLVYKGYCLSENCFTLEQAKTLAGDNKDNNNNNNNSSNRRSRRDSGGNSSRPPRPSTSQQPQRNRSKTKRSVFAGGSASSLTGTTNKSYQKQQQHHQDDINDIDSTGGDGGGGGNNNNNNNGRGNVGRRQTDTTNHNNNHNHNHNKINLTSHKPDPKAFPPPELKSTTNFEIHDDRPYFVIEKSALCLKEDTVTILDLSNLSDLRLIDIQAISTALQVNTTLQSLIFENCSLTDEYVNIIGEGLHEAKDIPLTKLYLRSNSMSDDAIDSLCPFLEANTTLEKIDVSRNKITSRGGVAIFNAFQRNRLTRIRCINLGHNELWNLTEDKFGIQSFLLRNRTIQVLNLEANYISDDGCEAITHGLIDNDQTCLERLYLGWNSIGDDGLIALSQLLETNTSLKVLGVGENQIKNAGARSLLVAMNYNTTIKEISGLWRNQIERRFIIVAIRRLLLSPNRVVGVEEGKSTTIALMEQQQQQPPSLSKSYSSNSTRSRSWKDSIEQAPVTIDSRMDDVDTVTTGGGAGGGDGGDYGGGMINNTTTYSLPSADSQDNNSRESQQQQNEEGGENVAVPSTNLLPAASAAAAGRQQQQNPNLQQPNRMIQMKQKLGGSTSSKMSSFKSLLSGGKSMSGKSISSSTTKITPADHEAVHQSKAKSPRPPPILVNGSTSTEVEQQQQQKHCDPDHEDVLHVGGGDINNDDILPYDCLTVIQSAPLAYFDRETGIHKAVPLIDYQSELKTIKEAVREAVGAQIDVLQEMATLEGLTEFFNDDGGGGRRHVMHFTSYGGHNSDHQIELENGYGSIHTLPVDGLKRLMEDEEGNGTGRGSNGNNNKNSLHSGGCCLRVVFVSSCHSLAIGQAFVDAGVPHVVCCQREKKYHDELVSEFTHKFYRALADNKLLQQAFNIALKAVNASGCSKKSRLVSERFCLLPEPSENNTYIHEVPVFFTQTMTPRSSSADNAIGPFHFPKSPKNFLGREVDMYEILEALRVDDVVKILSPVGHGKDSVVAAVCEYAMQRRNIFSVDDILWLPSPAGVIPEEDSLYGDLSLTINIIKNSQEDIWETDEVLLECRERIEIELEELQVVLVIDDRDFKFRGSQEGLEKFISYLLNSANAKVIMITSRRSSELTSTHSTLSTSTSGSRIEEASIEIGPLDFKSTARLFGENSKYIASNGCPAAHSGNEFAELLEPAFISKMPDPSQVISQRRSDLFLRMGNGLPSRVINAAESMSKDDFIGLIGIANRPEVFVDSLGALEKELEFRKLQREKAIEERNFMRAMDLDIILEELEGMRPEFPTLDDLREEEALMKEELAAAVKNRHYDTANDLKRELLTLKKKIMKEQRLAPDNTKDTSDRLNALQAQVQSMIEGAELTHDVNTDVKSATFAVQCDGRDCSFVIYPGEVYDFEHPSEAMGIVCWGNESCELKGTEVGHKLLERGGPLLEDEIAKLPIKMSSPYGPIRCGTGNALILGPEEFGDLEAPCVILSVGPLSPTNSQVDAIDDNTDSLHHITMMLRSCYRSSLVLARHAELQALAISLLTTRKEGQAYAHTLRLGLKTLIEEVKFSHLRDLHIAASSQKEASILIAMMSEMGYRQIYN